MIKIAINTSVNYSDKTLPVLLPSLAESGIEMKDIFIFEGGHGARKFKKVNEVNYFYTNHNSFDYTSFIEILEMEIFSDYWFYLHDTCRVGKKFNRYIRNFPSSEQKCVSPCRGRYANIGLYNMHYLNNSHSFISQFKNTDYSKSSLLNIKNKCIETEGKIMLDARPHHIYYQEDADDISSRLEDWYGCGQRMVIYLNHVDVFKSQANYSIREDKKYLIEI